MDGLLRAVVERWLSASTSEVGTALSADDFPVMSGEGRLIWLRATRMVLEDGSTVIRLDDVSELRELTQRVLELERVDTLGVFSQGLAHQIRNQLTVIVNSKFAVDRVQDRLPVDVREMLRESLAKSVQAVKLSLDLIQSFADFSMGVSEPGEVDLVELVDGALHFVHNTFIKSRIEVSWSSRLEKRATFPGDRGAVREILLKVLKHFVMALPAKSHLSLTVDSADDSVRVGFRSESPPPGRVTAGRGNQDLEVAAQTASRIGAHVEFVPPAPREASEAQALEAGSLGTQEIAGLDIYFTTQPRVPAAAVRDVPQESRGSES